MDAPRFDNRFVRELPGDPQSGPGARQVHGAAFSRVDPTPVADPQLVAWSPEMAATLGLGDEVMRSPAFAQVFGGNAVWPGMEPYAANYGGHQFGHWAGQLGDGRAITLGEVLDAAGQRWELQLKGAGPTPYSRTADGRAVLRSSIREFLCSEAMHALGVPTTRALSLVTTGDDVLRDMFYDGNVRPEPGAIVCRMAPSFIRFGNFELPASRGDAGLLRELVDFCIRRDYPSLPGSGHDPHARWFAEVGRLTARMVAEWMRVGFVHGVMNTDNMSILGLTIDYGPYGWIDNFDPDWTPNTTDRHQRRYRFGQQPQVAYWNFGRLGAALATLFDDPEPVRQGMQAFVDTWLEADRDCMARKLGLTSADDADVELVQSLHALLTVAEADMTLFFRALADIDASNPAVDMLGDVFYDEARREAARPELEAWLRRYCERVATDPMDADARRSRMNRANPLYVPRNYLAQQAIDDAENGNFEGVHELQAVFANPYDVRPGLERFAGKRPDWARQRAGCSMLSCSS